MMTQKKIQSFIDKYGITINYLAERSGVRPYSIYRVLDNENNRMRVNTEKKIELAMLEIKEERQQERKRRSA